MQHEKTNLSGYEVMHECVFVQNCVKMNKRKKIGGGREAGLKKAF